MHRAHRVGAREAHAEVGVERGSRRRRLAVRPRTRRRPGGTGSSPRRSCAAKRSKSREVVVLQLAELPAERRCASPCVTTATTSSPRTAPGCTARARAPTSPSSGRVALHDLAGAEGHDDERPLPPRRPRTRRGPSGRRSGRWWGGPGRGPPSGRPAPLRPARAAGDRRSRGRPAPATTPRAAGRAGAPHPTARSWCGPARRTWS